jgi:O-antigen ligase
LTKAHTACAVVAALFLATCAFSHTVALRLMLLAAGIVLASIVVSKEKQLRGLPPIWIPFVAWGAWALLSLAWSIEPDRSFKEWRNEVFYTAAGLWICYVGAQARRAAPIFLVIIAAAGSAAALIAVVEFSRGWAEYVEGLHGGPGDHSSVVLALMPCAAMAAWLSAQERRWPAAVSASCVVAVLFAGAYTTLNRTVWLGLAGEFALLAGFIAARSSLGARLGLPPRALVAGVALGALLVSAAMIVYVQAERRAVGAGDVVEKEPRLLLWPQVVQHIGERPLAGYGFGRGLLRDSLQEELRRRDTNLWHAHNIFLDAVLQTGVPGALLLLAVILATLRLAWRAARHADPWIAACGVTLAALVVGTLARNMTDTLLVRQNALLFWGLVGALLAMMARREATAS